MRTGARPASVVLAGGFRDLPAAAVPYLFALVVVSPLRYRPIHSNLSSRRTTDRYSSLSPLRLSLVYRPSFHVNENIAMQSNTCRLRPSSVHHQSIDSSSTSLWNCSFYRLSCDGVSHFMTVWHVSLYSCSVLFSAMIGMRGGYITTQSSPVGRSLVGVPRIAFFNVSLIQP